MDRLILVLGTAAAVAALASAAGRQPDAVASSSYSCEAAREAMHRANDAFGDAVEAAAVARTAVPVDANAVERAVVRATDAADAVARAVEAFSTACVQ